MSHTFFGAWLCHALFNLEDGIMKRLLMIIIAIATISTAAMLGATSASAKTSEFAGGSGTKNDPYIIETIEHLKNVSNYLSACYLLNADLVFTSDDFESISNSKFGWIGIGTSDKPFRGVFDGNNHSISGLQGNTSVPSSSMGLFSYNTGIIKNLHLKDCDFYAETDTQYSWTARAGAIAGVNKGTIEYCSSSGNVYATTHAGGIVGENFSGGTITRSWNNATVSSRGYAGGIAGENEGSITDCYNTGAISSIASGSIYVGGIVGEGWYPSRSYNVGNVPNGGAIIGYVPAANGGSYGSSCYYMDNVTNGAGHVYGTDLAVKLSSNQMMAKESFEKLDFATTWQYDTENAYPYPVLKEKLDYSSYFAGGDGSENNPFQISNAEELGHITKDVSAHYILICDIIFSDSDYNNDGLYPSGWKTFSFNGTFDGNGYAIKNLKVTAPTYCSAPGLFSINNGIIRNLTIESARYTIGYIDGQVGLICSENNGTILNCKSKNCLVVFNSSCNLGGIVGNNAGTVQNCMSENNLTLGTQGGKVGGIASNNTGNIIGCTNRTTITNTGSDYHITGGIVSTNSGKIIQCRNLASIYTTSNYQNHWSVSGGIAGTMSGGEISECYNTGLISAETNKKSSNAYAGGLVGNLSGGKITNCYNIGNISASNNASGKAYSGGLLGYNNTINDVTNCYVVCEISASSKEEVYGGLICGYSSVATINNCYFAGLASGAVGFGDSTQLHGVNKEELKVISTYTDFNFADIWVVNNDVYKYPQLRSNQHECDHAFSNDWNSDSNNHWYSCNCEGCSVVNTKAQHSYTTTCDTTCNTCGYTRTITHSYKTTWDNNSTQHWHICSACGFIGAKTNHGFDNSCDTSCNTCGYTRTINHSYKNIYEKDSSKHWRECSVCGVKINEDVHVYDNSCDTTCNTCGHTRSITHSYKITWENDKDGHWHECSVCGMPDTKSSHTPGAAATETTAQTCTTCVYVIKAALGHTHTYENKWTTNSGKHWHACSGCGDRKDEASHAYDNACDTDCNTCGYVRAISHSYKATWESDENQHWHNCSICGTSGTKSSHNYDNDYDEECNSCNHTRRVETTPDATTTLDETTEGGNTTMPNTTEPDVTVPDTTDGDSGKESGKKDDGNTTIIIIVAVASIAATAGIASAVFAVILKKKK